jgi:hypothetical protein
VLSSDDDKYNGQDRIAHVRRSSFIGGVEGPHVKLYLPCRTAMVLQPVDPQMTNSDRQAHEDYLAHRDNWDAWQAQRRAAMEQDQRAQQDKQQVAASDKNYNG